MVETIDDVVSDIANQIGIYGACSDDEQDDCSGTCRSCFEVQLRERILEAICVEKLLYPGRFD